MAEDSSKDIACLGWGSLIWDPRDLPLAKPWLTDGPALPLEFARKSQDGRMTLVVCPEGTACTVLWATLKTADIDEARKMLADREGLPTNTNAAYWTPKGTSKHLGAAEIGEWAKKLGLPGVVWTGLPPKSPITERNGDFPTVDTVLQHLNGLSSDARLKAEEYVRRAPKQIQTGYRDVLAETLNWTPEATFNVD